MPGIEIFNRRWNFGSDDLFYPGLLELCARSIWFLPQLIYYIKYQIDFKCADVDLLHVYYVGFLCLLLMIIINQLLIVLISSKGSITNITPRKHINKCLYFRSILVLIELIWSIIGTIWLAKVKWNSCSNLINFSVLANIIFCWFAIIFLIIVLFILFDPISHLPETDIHTKRNILYSRLKSIFFCCYCCLYTGNSRNAHYENSYKQISSILELIFRGGNLTPSDVLAGIILLSNKEKDQFSREYNLNKKFRNKLLAKLDQIPIWMNINEASYYIKYAVATYSWPYYIYMHNIRGCKDVCCSTKTGCFCCCSIDTNTVNDAGLVDDMLTNDELRRNLVIHGDTKSQRHLKAFKFLCKIQDCDLVYANFENDLFFVPFCVLIDHYKKSIVITIRGTLSLRDVITDITAECGYFDIDHLKNQPCHIGILNTAENIYNKLKSLNCLEDAFKKNPTYQLMVTGHSLGAGTAVILSLKLKKDYPNVKCIAYSPPGGLVSTQLAEYTKSFIMSVVVGDDIVPRLSLRSVHNLKADILKEIYNCYLPKYKIIWKYSISFVKKTNDLIQIEQTDDEVEEDEDDSILDELNSSTNSSNSRNMLINKSDLNKATIDILKTESRDGIYTAKKIVKSSKETKLIIKDTDNEDMIKLDSSKPLKASIIVKQLMTTVYETYPELQIPGNILYIYQIKSILNKRTRCKTICSRFFCFCCNNYSNKIDSLEYDSRWATREEFKKILITNRLFMDHFPNQVENALKYFNRNQNNHLII